MKYIKLFEDFNTNDDIKEYDVIKTLSPDKYSNYNGLGVVTKVTDDYIYVLSLPSMISNLVYNTPKLNPFRLIKNNNVVKYKGEKDGVSLDNLDKYKTYLELLKKYVNNEL